MVNRTPNTSTEIIPNWLLSQYPYKIPLCIVPVRRVYVICTVPNKSSSPLVWFLYSPNCSSSSSSSLFPAHINWIPKMMMYALCDNNRILKTPEKTNGNIFICIATRPGSLPVSVVCLYCDGWLRVCVPGCMWTRPECCTDACEHRMDGWIRNNVYMHGYMYLRVYIPTYIYDGRPHQWRVISKMNHERAERA